jgi:hypothetical protein
VTTSDRLRGLWRPPAETIAGMAAVLREHWRAAARMRPARLFWPTPGRWLKGRPAGSVGPVDVAPVDIAPFSAAVTTLPAAAGSSDKLPDPHQS